MIFEPVNKLMVVEKQPDKKAKSIGSFVIPENTLPPRYSVVKLVRAEKDFSSFVEHEGRFLVVQTALIDEVEFDGQKFHVISENGVVGILKENEL